MIRQSVGIALLIDHEQHVDILEAFASSNPPQTPWDVFVKLDVGSRRAGVPTDSPRLSALVQRTLTSSATVSLKGFYCHAGHSYSCRTHAGAAAVLQSEVDAVAQAARLVPPDRDIVVSIGATPTAHVIRDLVAAAPTWGGARVTLELHAGNFPANDLQQVSTGLVPLEQQAVRVVAEVCGVYPERGEALINAGTIALSKELGGIFPGFGSVCEKPGWVIARMSQEHGILAWDNAAAETAATTTEGPKSAVSTGSKANETAVEMQFRIGDKVTLYCAHSCITAAAFYVYYVVDENDIVEETWLPWKGW